jgi:hypothetical protein
MNVTLVATAVVVGLQLVFLPQTALPAGERPIPELKQWERQMVHKGRLVCERIARPLPSFDDELGETYYDRVRVMVQIREYTQQPSWDACLARALAIYRDRYVLVHKGEVPGYWNFTTGLRLHYARTGDVVSKNAILALSTKQYAADTAPLEWTRSYELSREVAYAILSYIDAEAVGEARRTRRALLVDQAYDHLDQWFVRAVWIQNPGGDGQGLTPFAVGLTAHSLIRDWEQTGDARLIPALRRAADWLWANAWMPRAKAMWYASGSKTPAPDLNLLIAPMYAFLYHRTGLDQYRDQGDALFAEGVRGAWLDGGKQFNQNYWWSFDYVRWRAAPPSSG